MENKITWSVWNDLKNMAKKILKDPDMMKQLNADKYSVQCLAESDYCEKHNHIYNVTNGGCPHCNPFGLDYRVKCDDDDED